MSVSVIPLGVILTTNLQMELTYSGLRVDVENFQGCGATMTIFSTEILYKIGSSRFAAVPAGHPIRERLACTIDGSSLSNHRSVRSHACREELIFIALDLARASFSKLGSESAVSVESVDSPRGTVGGGGSLAAARRIARSARATLEGEAV
jgi:hypothetical protein